MFIHSLIEQGTTPVNHVESDEQEQKPIYHGYAPLRVAKNKAKLVRRTRGKHGARGSPQTASMSNKLMWRRTCTASPHDIASKQTGLTAHCCSIEFQILSDALQFCFSLHTLKIVLFPSKFLGARNDPAWCRDPGEIQELPPRPQGHEQFEESSEDQKQSFSASLTSHVQGQKNFEGIWFRATGRSQCSCRGPAPPCALRTHQVTPASEPTA